MDMETIHMLLGGTILVLLIYIYTLHQKLSDCEDTIKAAYGNPQPLFAKLGNLLKNAS